MRKVADKPYAEDKYSYFGILKKRIAGKELPLFSENSRGENVIITAGRTEDGTEFITLKTMQKNDWIGVATYYEDGTEEETYEK